MTARTIGYVVLINPRTDGETTWAPDWDAEVHADPGRAARELADCRGDGHQSILGTVLAYDDEDLAHRAVADTGGIFSVRPPAAPSAEDQYAAELKSCLDFTVTSVHLALLRRLNWRWNGAPDELAALQSRKARVRVRHHGQAWTGMLVGLIAEPSILVAEEGGRLVVLPQAAQITLLHADPDAVEAIDEALIRSGFSYEERIELVAGLLGGQRNTSV